MLATGKHRNPMFLDELRKRVAQKRAVAIAVRGGQAKRRWTKLSEWLANAPDQMTRVPLHGDRALRATSGTT